MESEAYQKAVVSNFVSRNRKTDRRLNLVGAALGENK